MLMTVTTYTLSDGVFQPNPERMLINPNKVTSISGRIVDIMSRPIEIDSGYSTVRLSRQGNFTLKGDVDSVAKQLGIEVRESDITT